MKTYVLIIGKSFQKGHPKAGLPTDFKKKLMLAHEEKTEVTVSTSVSMLGWFHTGYQMEYDNGKIHTVRDNMDRWQRIVDEVNAGTAELALREWSGMPYNSKQVEILRFGKGSIGIQLFNIEYEDGEPTVWVDGHMVNVKTFANNDGLSEKDFLDWFPVNFTGCVLHFSTFRYLFYKHPFLWKHR